MPFSSPLAAGAQRGATVAARGTALLIALLVSFLPAPGTSRAPAAEVVLPAELITSESGMAAEWVLSMAQDRQGFMWFGTNLGLVRHDGLHFKVFRRANTLPNPLSNDYIYAMAEDAAGDLWLGTIRGLNHFHAASETFSAFRHDPKDPQSLSGDAIWWLCRWSASPDSLWVATDDNGLGLFNMRSGKCRSFRADPARPGALGSNSVRMVLEDSRGQVWVATSKGLHRFLPASETFEAFRHDPGDANTIGDDSVFEIFESSSQPGILWVGTDRNCLNRFDPRRRAWQRFLLPAAQLPDPFSNCVFFVKDCPDQPDMLLVGTRQGLYGFDMLRHAWQRIVLQDQFHESGDRRDEIILGIFRDRSGVCWVCVQGRGLLKFTPRPALFRPHVNPDGGQDPVRRNRVFSLAEDAGGNIWLGTAAGIYRYAPDTESYEHFALAPALREPAPFNSVFRVCATRSGELWAGTAGGLVRFDPVTGEQEVFAARAGDPATLGFSDVAMIHEDSRGDVWICSDFCLLRWQRRSRTFARYLHDPGDPGSLSASHINPVLEDRSGRIWIGTENGLNLYDRRSDKFKRYYLDPPDASKETQNYIMILHQDARGRIWVGTSNGLNLMEERGTGVRFRHFAAPGSTLRNFILGMLEDDAGNLWISSSGGLSRFDTGSETFSLYDSHDGVPHIEFIYNSTLCARTGELFFGGALGLFSFKPWLASFNRYVPPMAFTDIQLWRRPLGIGGGSPLPRSITLAPELVLPHDQNSLTLSFAALSYIRPEKNQYAYRLEGRDDSWIDLGYEHSVNLENLKPGRYRLRVKGSNNEGVWNERGISLALIVRPPFWETWWFRSLLALALLAAFVQWNRSRSRRLAARIRSEAAMEHYFDKFGISPREREIVRLLLRGKSNREIEDALFISMGTVKNHIYRIFQKLGVKNRAQLIARFNNLQIK
jgi:ligand-binding sensor domain-containing protein/DNA-binding CsgD family transcriptional regulator